MEHSPHNTKQQDKNQPVLDPQKEIISKISQADNLQSFYGKDMVEAANKMGEFLEDKNLKTAQIRKFLDAVKRLKYLSHAQNLNFRDEAMMIKPKLAYAAGRQNDNRVQIAVKSLMNVMNACIDRIHDQEDFKVFHQFVEAIVAYHKFHGGE